MIQNGLRSLKNILIILPKRKKKAVTSKVIMSGVQWIFTAGLTGMRSVMD